MTIETAKLHFNSQGTPVADNFDDVYFSNADGLEESRFVFIHHNDLESRWCQHQKDEFCVAETGFGTGLNFLACWQAFTQFRKRHPESPLKRLRFISTEKHPLNKTDLTATLDRWPSIQSEALALIAAYPSLVTGCHRLQFHADDALIELDLWLGDIHDTLPHIHPREQGIVEAWFLDGFAPSKNPDMWSDNLFWQMARLAKPKATFATFTAAGFVRRGLQAVGFEVNKVPGFGRKREMLAGTLTTSPQCVSSMPWCHPHPAATDDIAIIGGGLAAANLAYSLCQQGHRVKVFSKGVADEASGNRQGGFYPQLQAQDNAQSRFMASSFEFAYRRYKALAEQQDYAHDFCGVLQLAFNDATEARLSKLTEQSLWPDTLAYGVSANEAERIAGVTLPYAGLFFPNGGWIAPNELVHALFAACGNALTLHSEHQLTELTPTKDGWHLAFRHQSSDSAKTVVLATGAPSVDIPWLDQLPLRPVRGQVEAIPAQVPIDGLKTVLCHKGYLTPAYQGRQALGSTYVKQDRSTESRQAETEQNIAQQQTALADCDWVKTIMTDGETRAAVRLSTPDHLPLAGCVPDVDAQYQQFIDTWQHAKRDDNNIAQPISGLMVLTGFGSRALCTAPLVAEALACQISGKALPLPLDQLAALAPNRFLIRQWRRGS